MKTISVVTPCYNEQDNVSELYNQVKQVFQELPQYQYEHIFIDNASTDNTLHVLKTIAEQDKNVKIIRNARNFGTVRSPYYGMLQATGDAVIYIVADLQDPPPKIKDFIIKWEEGYKLVVGVKPTSEEFFVFAATRKLYYRFVAKIAEVTLVKNYNGFGLYDKCVIEILRRLEDPYPYLRGLISEIGFEIAEVPYYQPTRKRGVSKNNFYSLYDWAMLGITSHSKVPLRLATMAGFVMSSLSLVLSFLFLLLKLIFWKHFTLGMAPVLIGLFFFSSVQLFFIGLLGEYIGSIHTRVLNRPLVIESERINFE